MTNQNIESHKLTEENMEIVLEAVKNSLNTYPTTVLEQLSQLDVRDLIRLEVTLDMICVECKGLIYKKSK